MNVPLSQAIWWSYRGVEAKHVASPNAACPGLHWKPLDAVIRQLIALYRPIGHHGTINKTTMQNIPSLLSVLMAIAMRWYYTPCIIWWRRFMAFIKATKRRHRTSTHSNITKWTRQRRLILSFHHEIGLQLTCWPLIKIGVWHIKLMGTT